MYGHVYVQDEGPLWIWQDAVAHDICTSQETVFAYPPPPSSRWPFVCNSDSQFSSQSKFFWNLPRMVPLKPWEADCQPQHQQAITPSNCVFPVDLEHNHMHYNQGAEGPLDCAGQRDTFSLRYSSKLNNESRVCQGCFTEEPVPILRLIQFRKQPASSFQADFTKNNKKKLQAECDFSRSLAWIFIPSKVLSVIKGATYILPHLRSL